jgi:hypothetical protein
MAQKEKKVEKEVEKTGNKDEFKDEVIAAVEKLFEENENIRICRIIGGSGGNC